MDKHALVENLSLLFRDLDKNDKKYATVWLKQMDFGGLYMSDKFRLNVKAHQPMDNSGQVISDIVYLLYDHAREEYNEIFDVAVFNPNDPVSFDSNDLVVYDEYKRS